MAHTTTERLLARAAREGNAEYEGWLLRKGGGLFWGNSKLSAITDSAGRIRGFSIVTQDTTPRMRGQRAQALLSDASAALAQSLDSAEGLQRVARLATRDLDAWCVIHLVEGEILRPVAIAHADPEKEPRARAALGSIPGNGRNPSSSPYGVFQVVHTGHSELHSEVEEALWPADALGVDLSVLRDLGLRSYMSVPVTARGKALGAITLVATTAQSRFTHEDLLVAEELGRRVGFAVDNGRLYTQAQTAVRLREEILGIVSHDLRAPLNLIALSTAQLLRSCDREKQGCPRQTLESIVRASKRMDRMIRDLLDFSSIEAGRFTLELAHYDSGALVADAVDAMRSAAGPKCTLRAEQDAHAEAICDRDRILQVSSNLISNAIQFSEEGGVVTVGASIEPLRVVFHVSDTGRGIAPDELPHIFDRYWRSKKSGRERFGLGLAISKGIVEAHGGSIWVESALGKGSTFFFSTPRYLESAA